MMNNFKMMILSLQNKNKFWNLLTKYKSKIGSLKKYNLATKKFFK